MYPNVPNTPDVTQCCSPDGQDMIIWKRSKTVNKKKKKQKEKAKNKTKKQDTDSDEEAMRAAL